ncbi:MAG: T9SS type A sorting domain-containing protein [Ignavibacteria bacterium]|nr:T9SS type A sorting domain-containing protein [Ignavibacteria bacterium]
MTNSKLRSAVIVVISLLAVNLCQAEMPAYKLSVENIMLVSSNTYEFDILLQHTNSHESKFRYVLGQYFFDFNPAIANGGSLTLSITGSDLPENLRPRNPNVSGSQLRMAANAVPGKENLPSVSTESPGTLIARVRLTTSAGSMSDAPLNLKFRTGPENPFTKVFAYVDNQIVDVTRTLETTSDNNPGAEDNTIVPKEYSLQQNFPNPFNPATRINYELPAESFVTLKIYDITGKEMETLVNENQNAGTYSVQFDGSRFASGVYFYRFEAGNYVQVRKMFLVK